MIVMKVLVLNSSPKDKELSVTKQLTEQFVQGLTDAGAEVEVYDLKKMSINYCIDCGSCVTLLDGKCVINDEMTEILYPKFLEADAMVLSTPIYFGMMNSIMKKFIERLFPYLGPWQKAREGEVCQDIAPLEKSVAFHNMILKMCVEENVNTMQYRRNRINDNGAFTANTLDSFMDMVYLQYLLIWL